MTWQPIETAPINTFVLVCRDSGMMAIDLEYLTARNQPDYKGWMDVSNDRLSDSGSQPTHWMPLPEPPEVQSPPSSPLLWSHDVVE